MLLEEERRKRRRRSKWVRKVERISKSLNSRKRRSSMPLIDRFRLDDVEELKWKCPFCDRLLPTMNAVVGHILFDHTAEKETSDLVEAVDWAKMMADMAEPYWVLRKQRYWKA